MTETRFGIEFIEVVGSPLARWQESALNQPSLRDSAPLLSFPALKGWANLKSPSGRNGKIVLVTEIPTAKCPNSSAGDPPASFGDSPNEMEARSGINPGANRPSRSTAIPSGGSPDGTGGSPVLPKIECFYSPCLVYAGS